MKGKKDQCQYKYVCNGCNQRCKSCALKYAPYSDKIAAQIKLDNSKSHYKYEDECRYDLAQEILNKKSK